MKIKVLFIFLVLMLMPLVSSLNNVVKQNTPYDIRFVILVNGSIDTVTANITINDPDGVVIVGFEVMQKNTAFQDFNFTLNETNTTKLGEYDCTIYAFSLTENRGISCDFEVNPSGKEYIPQITGPLMFGAILTLMFLSIFLLILSSKIDLFPMKVFLLILSGIIAIMNIGFVAGSFQEFFSIGSTLSGAFGVLYIIFIMLLTGSSIFLMIWGILTGFKIYRIKRGFFIDPDGNAGE